MEIVFAALGGFVLDLLLGDPAWMPHPVVAMGRCITSLERRLRAAFPKTPRGERTAGRVLAAALPLGTLALSLGLLRLCRLIHPALAFALEILWCWQSLAARDLAEESEHVRRRLTEGTLEEARLAVGRIVGRDTAALSPQGVTRAAVETVAENTSDGVVAPLVFLALGGAPLGFFYKAVNTMDSMLGYVEPPYRDFGFFPAKLDDVMNFVPARLSAMLMLGAGGILGMDVRRGFRIFCRDRHNHASPNSAQTESVCAGLLGLRLAGDAWYHGVRHEKPTIGDPAQEIRSGDIPRACRLMTVTAALALAVCAGTRWLLMGLWG